MLAIAEIEQAQLICLSWMPWFVLAGSRILGHRPLDEAASRKNVEWIARNGQSKTGWADQVWSKPSGLA